MKLHIANYEPNRVGGGWTFTRLLSEGLGNYSYDEADTYLISGATMVQREDVEKAKADGKRVILRVDNAVRNSRNRNTGMSRMYDFAQLADIVVYQSQWAREYLSPFLKKYGPVILNGTDIELFKPGEKEPGTILYSRFNRDETKNWEVARYWFSKKAQIDTRSKLHIVGNFSDELRSGNFDFYNGEQYHYFGVLSSYTLSKLLAVTEGFLYTYFNDACSNSLIEALAADCKILGDEYYRTTGGAPEIIAAYETKGREHLSYQRMCREYELL